MLRLDRPNGLIAVVGPQSLYDAPIRWFAEKTICPNLRAQAGPMGGGDGKVDTKTYPVADAVSDGRWIAAPRGDDRWAFAFSAMKDWKRKVRSDVVKIAETDRGYCRRNSEHERRLSRVAHLSARRSGQGGAHQRLVEAGSVVLTSVMGAAATPPNSGRSQGRRRVISGGQMRASDKRHERKLALDPKPDVALFIPLPDAAVAALAGCAPERI